MRVPDDDYLWPFAGLRPFLLLFLLIALTLTLFNLYPSLDIAASRAFFDPTPCPRGQRFCIRFMRSADPTLSTLRQILHVTPVVLALTLVTFVTWRIARGTPVTDKFNRAALALVGAYALGAGVLVNLVLKVYWWRPRPLVTDLFGGWYPFVPAGGYHRDCVANCDSFVSGEAASLFWLVALASLAPRQFRIPALAAAFAVATFGSLLRVVFGGHYLSDAILAGLLSLLVFVPLATLVRHLVRRAQPA